MKTFRLHSRRSLHGPVQEEYEPGSSFGKNAGMVARFDSV